MSIEQNCGMYTPVCDVCDDALVPVRDFHIAVDQKRREGWASRHMPDGWIDICCGCFEIMNAGTVKI